MTGKALRNARGIDLSASIRSMAQSTENQSNKLYLDTHTSNVFRFSYSQEIEQAVTRHAPDLDAGRPVVTPRHSVHIFDLANIYKGMALMGKSLSDLGRRSNPGLRSRRQSRVFPRETPLLPAFPTETFNTPSPHHDPPQQDRMPTDRRKSFAQLPSLAELKKGR